MELELRQWLAIQLTEVIGTKSKGWKDGDVSPHYWDGYKDALESVIQRLGSGDI